MDSSWAILRIRMASCTRCRSIGWIAENMKNSQNRSVNDMNALLSRGSCASGRIEAEDAFICVKLAVQPFGPQHQRAKEEPGDESPDMGPPRDAPSRRRHQELGGSLQDLHQGPEPDEHETGQ